MMASFGGDAMELHDPTVVFALIEYVRQRNGQSEDRSRAEDKEGEFAKGWNWKRVDFEIEWFVFQYFFAFPTRSLIIA